MGILDGILNPTKNTNKGYKRAMAAHHANAQRVSPFYNQAMQGGAAANQSLNNYLGLNGVGAQQQAVDSYMTSPVFNAQFDQGQRAIDQSAASRGMLNSGDTLKALQGYGQGLYAQDYYNHLGMLGGQQGLGFQGAGSLTDLANTAGQLHIGRGQAKDAGNQAAAGNVLGFAGTAAGYFNPFGRR